MTIEHLNRAKKMFQGASYNWEEYLKKYKTMYLTTEQEIRNFNLDKFEKFCKKLNVYYEEFPPKSREAIKIRVERIEYKKYYTVYKTREEYPRFFATYKSKPDNRSPEETCGGPKNGNEYEAWLNAIEDAGDEWLANYEKDLKKMGYF